MDKIDRTQRLTYDTYKRPKKTVQDKLTAEDIEEKLKFYRRVDDIIDVALNTHTRYFSIDKKGKKLFRLGGFITKKGNNGKYVVLSNGRSSWSVQIDSSIFYKKLTLEELAEEYEYIIKQKDIKYKKLKSYVKQQLKK